MPKLKNVNLTLRERRFLYYLARGYTETDAYLEIKGNKEITRQSAGASGCRMYKRILKKKISIEEYLDIYGINNEKISKKLSDLLDAKKAVFYEGKQVDNGKIEDGAIQLRALELIIDLLGMRELTVNAKINGNVKTTNVVVYVPDNGRTKSK